MPLRRLTCTLLALFSVTGIAWSQQGSVDTYAPRTVLRKPMPAITKAPFLSAEASKMRDSELVIGVVVNDQARAYPINQLTGPRREIINDTLGGTAIAATW